MRPAYRKPETTGGGLKDFGVYDEDLFIPRGTQIRNLASVTAFMGGLPIPRAKAKNVPRAQDSLGVHLGRHGVSMGGTMDATAATMDAKGPLVGGSQICVASKWISFGLVVPKSTVWALAPGSWGVPALPVVLSANCSAQPGAQLGPF